MPIPETWRGRLRLPVVVSPMFLASGTELVIAAARAGIVGTFPALNQRTSEGYAAWLAEISDAIPESMPYGVNLIVHRSNPRLDADLDATVAARVPLVITSLGAVSELVDAVHSYGGLVFHDVVNRRHAEKAADAGVDGVIVVAAGAGGHAGIISPFALVPEIREFFDGTIALAGALTRGSDILAAQALGADLAYMGTRFIPSVESMAPARHKEMIVTSRAADIVYTDKLSVAHANFLSQSFRDAGIDPGNLPDDRAWNQAADVKAWKDIYSAGHGVGGIDRVESLDQIVAAIEDQYGNARHSLTDRLSSQQSFTKGSTWN